MIKLKVSGENQQVDGDTEMALLWMLRDELDLKGTKFACGMGLCRACTVQVDGRPTRACFTPVSAVANKSVTTIEGISPEGSNPVPVAWQELDVPQCGYCQAGQIAEIDAAMNSNLWRCGTYLRIRAATHKAAEATPAKAATKPVTKAARTGARL